MSRIENKKTPTDQIGSAHHCSCASHGLVGISEFIQIDSIGWGVTSVRRLAAIDTARTSMVTALPMNTAAVAAGATTNTASAAQLIAAARVRGAMPERASESQQHAGRRRPAREGIRRRSPPERAAHFAASNRSSNSSYFQSFGEDFRWR